jgi:hypothetical protein
MMHLPLASQHSITVLALFPTYWPLCKSEGSKDKARLHDDEHYRIVHLASLN